jgi:hypothetical protein
MKVSVHGSGTLSVNTLEKGCINPLGCARTRSRMMVSGCPLISGHAPQQGRWLALPLPFQERT